MGNAADISLCQLLSAILPSSHRVLSQLGLPRSEGKSFSCMISYSGLPGICFLAVLGVPPALLLLSSGCWQLFFPTPLLFFFFFSKSYFITSTPSCVLSPIGVTIYNRLSYISFGSGDGTVWQRNRHGFLHFWRALFSICKHAFFVKKKTKQNR